MSGVTRVTLTYLFEIVGAPNDQVAAQLALANVSTTEFGRSLLKQVTVQAAVVTPEMLRLEGEAKRQADLNLRVKS